MSCIMPTYNRRQYVPTAIRSFLEQTHSPKELIIVDDGTDCIRSLVPEEACVRYLRLDSRLNTGMKRNVAAMLARGSVLCNWDDDDWSAPTRIEEQLRRLLASGKQLTGFRSTVYLNEADGEFYKNPGPPIELVSGTSQMYYKSWWDGHRYPDSSMGEDSEFSRVALEAGEIDAGDCGLLMVARAHAASTCFLDFRHLPKVPRESIPAAFLAEMSC